MQVDKAQLVEHLNTCIEIERTKADERTAIVLSNLREDIVEGNFDYGKEND